MKQASSANPTHRRVPAVSRAVQILRRLGASDEPVGVNPLARELGLVPSTCLHILRVLVDEGLVELDPATKRYAIGIGILPIARSAIQRNGFAALAQPVLDESSKRFGATMLATQLTETRQMVVVALSHTQLPFRLAVELGSRFPELISATGRCVAAFNAYDQRTLQSQFQQLQWENPPSFDAWLAQVEQTRQTGYGIDRGDYISGVTIIAAPLFNPDGATNRGLVAVGISEQIEAAGTEAIAAWLLSARDRLASMLLSG